MHKQHGGTILGFILGLVTGLAVALGVAVYVTKVPLPFLSKGQTRSADQNESETKKNKDWDPNALIANKPAPKTPAEPDPASASEPAAKAPPPVPAETRPDTKPAAAATPEAKAATSADPIGALAKAKTAAPEAPQISFYVQVGAFRTPDDAERHRAKLALKGVDAKITERELSGRPVYRARVGPFERLEDAESAKDKMDKLGIETALVKVQR
jgi:cell division protein FtsN